MLCERPALRQQIYVKKNNIENSFSLLFTLTSYTIIKWVGGRKKVPIVSFSPQVLLLGLQPEERQLAGTYGLKKSYAFVNFV